MIAAGYLFKRVVRHPEWIKNGAVKDIYSVSSHGSEDFADYINYWKHNGWWLFNKPADMNEIIQRNGIDRSSLVLFYYEVFEQEFDEELGQWSSIEPDKAFVTDVELPMTTKLIGFDVVSFSCGTSPECSPLFCNGLANEMEVNEHCLIDSFDAAKMALESRKFDNSEPGPFRIFAVYTVGPRTPSGK